MEGTNVLNICDRARIVIDIKHGTADIYDQKQVAAILVNQQFYEMASQVAEQLNKT